MSNSTASFNKKSKAAQEMSMHRVPCGPVSVNISAPCRRRLRDTFDKLLDKLCEKCHSEMVEPEIPDGYELSDDGKVMDSQYLKEQEKAKKEPTLEEGRMKNEVQAELSQHKDEVMPKKPEPKEPTLEERRKKLLDEAKMKAEVKVKAKEHEVRLQGNSKLLQRSDGKIEKR